MTTEQQSELEEIKQLISDRFDQQEQKISDRFDQQEQKISDRFDQQEQKISDRFDQQEQKISEIRIEIVKVESKLGQDIAGIKVDVTWIKWLLGGLLSFILVLLSVIITVIFKLIS